MDQGSNKNHSPAYNFTPTVTKFCVMWEGLSLPHDTKFGNCRCKIVDSRLFHSWSLIHGLRWSGLIKVGPGEYTWCNSCNCTSNFRHVTLFMVIIIILTAMGHVSDNMLKRIFAVRSCYFCTFQNISVCGSPSTNGHGSDRKTERIVNSILSARCMFDKIWKLILNLILLISRHDTWLSVERFEALFNDFCHKGTVVGGLLAWCPWGWHQLEVTPMSIQRPR